MQPKARAAVSGSSTGNAIRDSALGRIPETVDEIITLNRHVWQDSPMPASLLEIIRLRNARKVNCVFCRSVRYDIARRDGLTEDRAEMVEDGYETSTLSNREKLAIALADSYLDYPAGVPAELAPRLTAEFSQDEIASMLLALMTFNFTARSAVSIAGMPEEGSLPITEVPIALSIG